VVVKVDGETLVEFTEPDNPKQGNAYFDRRFSAGTVALQAHDPNSIVHFRRIAVRTME